MRHSASPVALPDLSSRAATARSSFSGVARVALLGLADHGGEQVVARRVAAARAHALHRLEHGRAHARAARKALAIGRRWERAHDFWQVRLARLERGPRVANEQGGRAGRSTRRVGSRKSVATAVLVRRLDGGELRGDERAPLGAQLRALLCVVLLIARRGFRGLLGGGGRALRHGKAGWRPAHPRDEWVINSGTRRWGWSLGGKVTSGPF